VLERKAIPEVVTLWNAQHSLRTAAILEPVLWETHARPELGGRPQSIINKQIVNNCDILVGAFWTRLGTHTGEAESGTVEEINEFRAAGKPVLLYFSSAPVVYESVDQEQYKRLHDYRERVKSEGIVFSYDSVAEFRELLLTHLTGVISEIHAVPDNTPVPAESKSEQLDAIRAFRRDVGNFSRRLNAEWTSERDSGPHSTDEGRVIMRHALSELLNFRSRVAHDESGRVSGALDEAIRKVRELERHRIYIDGGISFRRFWELGDAVTAAVAAVEAIPESEWVPVA
jgi:hypothetical protein